MTDNDAVYKWNTSNFYFEFCKNLFFIIKFLVCVCVDTLIFHLATWHIKCTMKTSKMLLINYLYCLYLLYFSYGKWPDNLHKQSLRFKVFYDVQLLCCFLLSQPWRLMSREFCKPVRPITASL